MKEKRLFASPFIYTILIGGEGVLLDVYRDQFIGLDAMGMFLWEAFCGGSTPQEVVQLVSMHYTIESEKQVREDVQRFLEQMLSQRLLLATQEEARPSRISTHSYLPFLLRFLHLLPFFRVNLWLEAWVTLWIVHQFLLHRNLLAISQQLHTLSASHVVSYEQPVVRLGVSCVQSAAAWHTFHPLCLHQNLALAFLLRKRAIRADVVIGVSTFPFFAHAWLTSGSEVINWETGLARGESKHRIEQLSPIFCTAWPVEEGVQ